MKFPQGGRHMVEKVKTAEKIKLLFSYPIACLSEGWWDYWHTEQKVQPGAFLLSGTAKRCFSVWGHIQKPQAELLKLEKLYFLTSGSDTNTGCREILFALWDRFKLGASQGVTEAGDVIGLLSNTASAVAACCPPPSGRGQAALLSHHDSAFIILSFSVNYTTFGLSDGSLCCFFPSSHHLLFFCFHSAKCSVCSHMLFKLISFITFFLLLASLQSHPAANPWGKVCVLLQTGQ